MTEPTVLRFEATKICADVFDETAILTMQTVRDGRVAVRMQRDVLLDLAAEIRHALNEEQPPVDGV